VSAGRPTRSSTAAQQTNFEEPLQVPRRARVCRHRISINSSATGHAWPVRDADGDVGQSRGDGERGIGIGHWASNLSIFRSTIPVMVRPDCCHH
jgi:hypothetical protein